jgi:hypothetical protein
LSDTIEDAFVRQKICSMEGGDEEEGSEKAFGRCFLLPAPLFLFGRKKRGL